MGSDTITLPKGFILEEPNLPKGFVLEKPSTQTLPQLDPAHLAPPSPIESFVSDPSEPPPGFIPEVESKTSFLRRMMTLGGKGLWKGLGVVTWPFERIEHAIATPATALSKAVTPLIREPFKDIVFDMAGGKEAFKQQVRKGLTPYAKSVLGEQFEPLLEQATTAALAPKKDVLREEVLPAVKELPSAFLTGGKAVLPYPLKKMGVEPEDLKTFNDFWGAYYEGMIGEKAPEWYKQTAGIGTSFLVVPAVFGKLLKGVGKVAKLTGIPQKIQKAKLPAWQIAKMRARMKIGARVEKATELGKSVGKQDLKQLAKELSKQTGKKVTTQAVQQRLGQIIKGSITTQPKLAAKANPIIEEFEKTSKILRKLNLLPEETFLTKLSKKRVAGLLKQKDVFQKQLTRLETAPHYVGTKEISKSFPGRAKKIAEFQKKIQGITDKLQQSYKAGAEKYLPRMYRSKEEERLARKFLGWSKHRIRAHYAKQKLLEF